MPIPFEPESIESLRARLPRALEKVWVPVEGMKDRPGLHREYVFDFPTEFGLRLLISKANINGNVEIQVSASWQTEDRRSLSDIWMEVETYYHLIGGEGRLKFLGLSGGGIPHWLVENEYRASNQTH